MDITAVQSELDDLLGIGDACSNCKQLSDSKKTYGQALKIALDIGVQYQILLQLGYGLLDIPRECVGETTQGNFRLDLAQLQARNVLMPLVDGYLSITRHFTHTDQMAPELGLTFRLPATCLPTVALYSLKTLCVWQLGMEHDMGAIYGTKLFYLLERCGRIKAQDRVFLYV